MPPSPATGNLNKHLAEQKEILEKVMVGKCPIK